MTHRPERESEALDQLRAYASYLTRTVTPTDSAAAAHRAVQADRRGSATPRWVVVFATIGLLAISNVGLAAAANPAVPGDFLYLLDRGYEWIGDRFGASDRSAERVAESEVLVQRGQPERALRNLKGTLSSLGATSGVAALDNAILAVQGHGADVADEVEGLVEATSAVAVAAQSGDEEAFSEAIEAIHAMARGVREAARGTAPGQTGDSPSDTAPGRNPSSNGNGQDGNRP
ncbi:MAG: hypothetical protein ACRDWH_01535 [Acidimicrobiia bacterium]